MLFCCRIPVQYSQDIDERWIPSLKIRTGKVYTATCLIHVKVPAEEISISHRKLKLSVGDTYTLKATVGPKKATIKTVTWYSDNEEIAVVAPDGTITAKRSGAVDIYAVADDGYFKATCHVEVEQ